MTMFDVDTVNVEKKLQEIEDNDLYNFMKKQGYSEEQIKSAIRNTHLPVSYTHLTLPTNSRV